MDNDYVMELSRISLRQTMTQKYGQWLWYRTLLNQPTKNNSIEIRTMITVWRSLELACDKQWHRNMDNEYVVELFRIILQQTMTQIYGQWLWHGALSNPSAANNSIEMRTMITLWSSLESAYDKEWHRNMDNYYVMELSRIIPLQTMI